MFLVEKGARALDYPGNEDGIFQDGFDEIGDFVRGEVRIVEEAVFPMDVVVIGALLRFVGDGGGTGCGGFKRAEAMVGESSAGHAKGAGQKPGCELPEGLFSKFEDLPTPGGEEAGGVELLETLIVVVGTGDEYVMLRRASPPSLQGVDQVILNDGRQVVDECARGPEPGAHKLARDVELEVVDWLDAGEGELARVELVGVVGDYEAGGFSEHQAADEPRGGRMPLQPA